MLSRWIACLLLFIPVVTNPITIEPPLEADLLIRNAVIYTMEAKQPRAEAVAIKKDRIVWVGSNKDAANLILPDARVLDAGGKMLLPGWIDAHSHIRLGFDPDVVRITGSTRAEILKEIRDFAQQRPDLKWIEGEGWNYSAFASGLPSASDLEGVTGGRPAFLMAYDYHTIWMNREGLAEFGITAKTKATRFARVEKDRDSGEPTGILTNFAENGLSTDVVQDLEAHLPSYSPERQLKNLEMGLATAARFGITTVVEPQSTPEDLELYEQARKKGTLIVRLQAALFHPRGTTDDELKKFDAARKKYNDDWLRVSAIKMYSDDVIEPHTAAMLAPYSDRPDEMGKTFYEPAEFNDVVAKLDRLRFQLFIHAIGDRGIRTALDSLEYARKMNGEWPSRHQLVHIECLSPQDVPRFKQLGVVACMQPRHCAPDITGQWAKAVGPERSRLAWAFRSLRDSGAVLAFASDWPVAEMDPLIGIYTALTRKGLDGKPEKGWIPEQTIDLETALRAYTINAAYANFVDQDRGSITPGKYADLILLSEDLSALPADKIKDARVILTMVGGKEVYRSTVQSAEFTVQSAESRVQSEE